MTEQKRMTKTKRMTKSKHRKNKKNIKYISKKVMKGGSICDLFTGIRPIEHVSIRRNLTIPRTPHISKVRTEEDYKKVIIDLYHMLYPEKNEDFIYFITELNFLRFFKEYQKPITNTTLTNEDYLSFYKQKLNVNITKSNNNLLTNSDFQKFKQELKSTSVTPSDIKLHQIETKNFIIYESGGGGDCFYFALYDSIQFLKPLQIFEKLKTCLNINFEDKNTFMLSIRELIANKLRENILFDVAKYDYEYELYDVETQREDIKLGKKESDTEEELREQKYQQKMNNYESNSKNIIESSMLYYNLLNLENDDIYNLFLNDNFKEILKLAPTIVEFKRLFNTIDKFNEMLYVLTIVQGVFANQIHISILNFLLKYCIFNLTDKFKIQAFTNDNLNEHNENNYITQIFDNQYKNKKIITIPIYHTGGVHYQSIQLL